MLIENRLIAYTLLALLGGAGRQLSDDAHRQDFCLQGGGHRRTQGRPPDAQDSHPPAGGLAIFIGFMVSILLFVEITAEMRSILLGAVIIVVLGVEDRTSWPCRALLKFAGAVVAALSLLPTGRW